MAQLMAVLWDHDGTLVDTEPYWIEAELRLAARFGAPWTELDGLSVVGSPLQVTAGRMIQRGVSMDIDEVIAELCTGVAHLIDERGIRWLPGVQSLLEEAATAGVRSAIVSNAYRQVVEKTIAALPEGTVDFVLTGDEMEHAKPNPWPYQVAAAAFGLAPENVIVIEDSLSGTLSAEAAGMPVLVVPSVAEIPSAPGRVRATSLEGVTLHTLQSIVNSKALASRSVL